MSRTAAPSPIRVPEVQVRLPELHDAQQQVFADDAQYKVVVCGRQWGKTVLGAVMCVAEAAAGGDAWWVAPSFPIGELGWRIIDHLCRQIPETRFEGRPVFRITLPTGGTIQLRSADNPDSLRGATLNLVVFDEAAQAKPEAWPTLEPTLAIRGGRALFISTPKGLNWFHDLYQEAGLLPGWNRWRFPSVSSPYMTPEKLAGARAVHSSVWYSQEYEAEFVSAGLGVFHADWIQHYGTRFEGEDKFYMLGGEVVSAQSCRTFHTVDLAWSTEERADYTVISTWAVTPRGHLILVDWIRGHFEGPDIVPKMSQAFTKHRGYFVVEKATRQMSIIQEAVRVGLPVRDVRAEKDKVARALPATARMERGVVWFPPASTDGWRDLEEEILAFPAGRHDDFVDTLAYAVIEAAGGSPYERHGLRTV